MSTGGFRSRSRSGQKRQLEQFDKPHQRVRHNMKNSHWSPGADPRSMGNVDVARALSFDVLYRVETEGTYANLALPAALREHNIKRRDAAFSTELTYGTLRSLGVVDAVIAKCSNRDLVQIDAGVLTALRMGAYQLLFMRVEDHAAVDSSVTIVKGIGQERASGFANAVLRNITRTPAEEWLRSLAPVEELARLAFTHSHPEWIARSFAQVLGEQELGAALQADSERPQVHLVARPGEISAEELALITEGEVGTYSPYAVYLPGGDPGRLEPVREGLAAVQDEGSQIIARALSEAPLVGPDGGRWLDLCAGPGGKAALLGCLARIDGATVDAVEIQPHRATLIKKSTIGLPIVVHTADGRDPGLEAGFDRVLVDAPCSGLGALRRRPEARWRKQEADIQGLSVLQEELLSSAISLVRPGGVVVYSTCSPDLRETREIVDKALANHPVEELPAAALACGMENTGEHLSVQMWPHRHGTDAMFFAVLRKTAQQQD